MLFQIGCSCGQVGITTSLPRMAHCSACDTVRLFRVADGYPIIAKLAAVDEEERQEQRERKLADKRMGLGRDVRAARDNGIVRLATIVLTMSSEPGRPTPFDRE